jgi:hypothetical protein
MKFASRVLPSLLVGIMLALVLVPICAAEGSGVRYVFLLDTSLSMVGQAQGATNIMDRVKSSMKDFVTSGDQTFQGATVTVATFSDTLGTVRDFPIRTSGDTYQVAAYIDTLKATGHQTHIYAAVKDLLSQVRAGRTQGEKVYLYLYTDGEETEPGKTITDTIDEFQAGRGSTDWLYYITLGVHLEEWEREALAGAPGMRLVEVAKDQRPPVIVEAMIPNLNFGDIDRKTARSQLFAPRGDVPQGLSLRLSVEPSSNMDKLRAAGAGISLVASEVAFSDELELKLKTINGDQIPEGAYTAICHVATSSPEAVVLPDSFLLSFYKGDFSYTAVLAPVNPIVRDEDDVTEAIRLNNSVTEIMVKKIWEKSFSGEYHLSLIPSSLVAAKAGSLRPPTAEIVLTKNAPQTLVSFSRAAMSAGLDASGGELDLMVDAAKGLRPGRYRTRIVFTSPEAPVKGYGVADLGQGQYEFPLTIDVAEKPVPLLFHVFWLLAEATAVLWLVLFGAASMRGTTIGEMTLGWAIGAGLAKPCLSNVGVYCLEPREARRSQEFERLTNVVIGLETPVFGEMPAKLRLQAVRTLGRTALRVSVDDRSGVFGLRRAGEAEFAPHSEALVWNDDLIQLGRYKLRIDSGDLYGGDSVE